MEGLQFLAIFVPVIGIGAIVLFIVAVIQEGKAERKGGFKQAFFTVVSLVMLGLFIGSSVALVTLGLKQYVFKNANKYNQRYNSPPPIYPGSTGSSMGGVRGETKPVALTDSSGTNLDYSCTDNCQFTEADKQGVENWVTSYKQWRDENKTNLPLRRELAGILAFLIVSAPLYFVFRRLMEKGAKVEMMGHKSGEAGSAGKPGALRSLYYYFVAFAGLIMAVIGLGGVINVGLKVGLKTEPQTFSEPMPVTTEDAGVISLIACADKCDFSDEQVAMANQWLTDAKEQRERQKSNAGQYDNDLAGQIPVVLIGFPLFWYHFARIRKESQDKISASPTPTAA